jgi:hypothetical protein
VVINYLMMVLLLTGFKLMSQYWLRKRGPFFKGVFLPQKWD